MKKKKEFASTNTNTHAHSLSVRVHGDDLKVLIEDPNITHSHPHYSLVEALYTAPEFCLVVQNVAREEPEHEGKKKAKTRASAKKEKSQHSSQRANIVGFVLGSIIVNSR